MKILKFNLIYYLVITICLISINLKSKDLNSNINKFCVKALEFYIDRPDLETEHRRRLEYCKATITDVSPKGYETNPIISDFKSIHGVNGRTRMQIHQGIDIIGEANQPIIAIADGIVLETDQKFCEGPSVVIDHGKAISGERLIAVYTHTGEFLVKAGDKVKRGMPVAKLPEKILFPCMARVRHLHLQIGQQYCEKHEKNTWGCDFYIKDKYSSLNPHLFWADGENIITCYDEKKKFQVGTITYPFSCKKL